MKLIILVIVLWIVGWIGCTAGHMLDRHIKARDAQVEAITQ